MTIEELYKEYADRQVSRVYPDLDKTNLPRWSKMSLNVFSGSDIELAVEFGAKAVLREIEEAYDIGGIDTVVDRLNSFSAELKERGL